MPARLQSPRQAAPPGADAMQSPQCICTSHLPSTGEELTSADTPQPPRQAAPPGADAMQSPQCICTSHLPPTGGELAGTEPTQPPRQAELDTPPQEGNGLPLPVSVNLLGTKTPPRQASPPGADAMQSPQCICTSHLPSTGGELTSADTPQPPRQAAPPGADAMQSPQCICTSHLPSTGRELTSADTPQPPRQASPATPPQQGN